MVMSQAPLLQAQRRDWATVHSPIQLSGIYSLRTAENFSLDLVLNRDVNSGNRKSSWDPHLEVSYSCLYDLSQDILFFYVQEELRLTYTLRSQKGEVPTKGLSLKPPD